MPKQPTATYQEIHTALEAILARLQEPDIQVDEAVRLYEEGLALAAKLEKHLEQAENTIKKMQLQGGGTDA